LSAPVAPVATPAPGGLWLAEADPGIRERLCARFRATGTAVRAFTTADALMAALASDPPPAEVLLPWASEADAGIHHMLATLRPHTQRCAVHAHALDAGARAAALTAGAHLALETPMLGRFIAARVRAGSDVDAGSTDTRTRDGRRVTIRCLRPEDADHEQAFVRGLSAASRRTRFFSAIRELSPAMLHAFTHPDYPRSCALVATVATVATTGSPASHADELQVAVARYACTNPFETTPAPRATGTADAAHAGNEHDEDASAEFAIVVADGWPGHRCAAAARPHQRGRHRGPRTPRGPGAARQQAHAALRARARLQQQRGPCRPHRRPGRPRAARLIAPSPRPSRRLRSQPIPFATRTP
jgi:hypothetical protein